MNLLARVARESRIVDSEAELVEVVGDKVGRRLLTVEAER